MRFINKICRRYILNDMLQGILLTYLAAIEMSIEVFYLCIFSRERGWEGQGEVSKDKGVH